MKEKGQPAYRAEQVLKAVFQDGVSGYDQITSLPAPLRAELAHAVPMQTLAEERVRVSVDGTTKAVLRLPDGLKIETVLMNPKGDRWTACVSSQVGCALACSFCATGLMGLKRNLTPEEITDQVLFWRQYIRKHKTPVRLSNVVYMGMGEPFHNTRSVFNSIKVLTDQKLFAIGQRHVAVSTAGVAPGIEEFGTEFSQVHLALSLHAANDKLRSKLVPVNKAYPLAKLRESLQGYFKKSNQKVFIEYILLHGENDGLEQAKELAAYLKTLGSRERVHVNLIVFNPTATPHAPSRREAAHAFRDILLKAGFMTTIRRNLGTDIEGACGQLVIAEPKKGEPKK